MGSRPLRLAAALCVALGLAACEDKTAASAAAPPGGMAGQPPEAAYMTVRPQQVPRAADLPGRVAPSAVADVRPQAEGVIRRMLFREGAQVKAGDALFELDSPRPRVAVDTAETALARAQASQAAAQSAHDRSANLYSRGFLSRANMESAATALDLARADVASARAQIESARIGMAYTTIRAPISGRIGKAAVNVGDLVTANQTTALATIRQIDPVYVDLADTSANILRLREEIQAGQIGGAAPEPKVRFTLETGTAYPHEGRVSLTDMVVSESTNALTLRAVAPNPEGTLLPGMYLRAAVELGSSSAVLAPQRAVLRNSTGEPIAYVIDAGNKIESRKLTLNGARGNAWVVMDGLKEGDRLVLDGFQKISPGATVRGIEGSVDENGVVAQEALR
ncbi:efflux RND transporter periplasmic adaptor subunit [Neomegalonema sp.]|uniref:efflux RND transporter periplasmic adaptor subunit n=1 Tax=Neomegalonema sp. TaxID=2039713 RepID=UPI00260C9B1B|nr:efflux RND transporter periplasmic adaptor subunit [Neomegalonema sp.]MDD2869264.1 efflux RND transporter periplasmic adaptor subunit [Neomegalonema sp.]